MKIAVLSLQEVQAQLAKLSPQRQYWVMYSSVYGGLVKDPTAMMIPLDDHMVHRGDGIFEAFRFQDKKIIDLDGHLKRLARSAEMVALRLPSTPDEMATICQAVVDHSPESTGMLRLFVSRGYGDFSPNPYSTTGSQLYVISTPFTPIAAEKYERGVSAGFSKIQVKPGFFAQVKSCNYLPNVLTKKEAVDQGWDFAINLTPDGFVAEGPTENILVLTQNDELIAPKFDYTLRGTTLLQVLASAEKLKSELGIKKIGTGDLTPQDLRAAKEIMMVGTTLAVLPVTQLNGQAIGHGQVGPIARKLKGTCFLSTFAGQ